MEQYENIQNLTPNDMTRILAFYDQVIPRLIVVCSKTRLCSHLDWMVVEHHYSLAPYVFAHSDYWDNFLHNPICPLPLDKLHTSRWSNALETRRSWLGFSRKNPYTPFWGYRISICESHFSPQFYVRLNESRCLEPDYTATNYSLKFFKIYIPITAS